MQYRTFGKLDWQGSVLGFGCARLPTLEGDYADVDEPAAIEMLRYAIDHGVNYLDTGYDYHGGNGERVVGKALQGGYRDKVRLATKLPCWLAKSPDDFDRFLDEQLVRLQTDHVDVYLLHRLNTFERTWPRMRDWGAFEWAEAAIADGRIGCFGFSFHDTVDVFQEIVDAYDGWAMYQIQYNYMDVEGGPGRKGLQYAASRGLAVVIMEPLLGGKLANPPQRVQVLWESAAQKRSPADWGLRWVWNQPEVSVVLSGMNTLEQVKQNIATASVVGLDALTPEELALFDQVSAAYQEYRAIPCTQCLYCMPCPNGVNIPTNFYAYNSGVMYENVGWWRVVYSNLFSESDRASACVQCRECEPKCSQRIPISEWMPQVHAVLGEGQPYPEGGGGTP